MIPASFLHDLLARTDIAEVVGRHVTLKKAGINYKGLCPFHGEKTPSFIVSPTRQTYHCFGCGVHGDAIRFLVEHAGLGFVDAVHELASAAGLKVPEEERSPEQRERADAEKAEHERLTDVLQTASTHYRAQLKLSPKAIDYLKRRGLTGQVAARFALGYAPAGWRSLASAFPSYDDPALEAAGLVITHQAEGDESAKRYDRFRDRVMFPIRDVRGKVIGFGGRILDTGEPKYLNSPETPVFVKGRELYGLFEARTAIREKGYALVTEGYMDVVALAQMGLPNAVATLGTACTADHVHKLLRFTDRVVFAFDGDAAGRKAAARALEAALPHATDTRSFAFLFLPTEHDPDSYIRAHGVEGFEKAVASAVPLSRQVVELAAEGCELSTAEGRARMVAQARPLWQLLPSGVLKVQVLEALAQRAGLSTPQLESAWGTERPADRVRAPSAAPQQPPVRPRVGRPAREAAPGLLDRALWILVHRPSLWDSLPAESQGLLAEQPSPYGPAFAWVERIGAGTDSASDSNDPSDPGLEPESVALLARVRSLHAPPQQLDLDAELATLLHRLELQAVKAELQMLHESGSDLSSEAQARGRLLLTRLSELSRGATPRGGR